MPTRKPSRRRTRLLIVGASGFGREVLTWARDVPQRAREWEIGGFLDANPRALDGFSVHLDILGDPATYEPRPNDRFVCAIGEPATKLRLCRALKAKGAVFETVVHPTALIPKGNVIGEGCIFCPRSCVSIDTIVGNHVAFNVSSGAGHDARLGDGCTLSAFAEVMGGAILGEGVFLGSHACVLPRVAVGDNAKIGAGAVVLRRVLPGATMFGNPARQVGGFEA